MNFITKALNKLGWVPKTTLEELIIEMLAEDRKGIMKESYIKNNLLN